MGSNSMLEYTQRRLDVAKLNSAPRRHNAGAARYEQTKMPSFSWAFPAVTLERRLRSLPFKQGTGVGHGWGRCRRRRRSRAVVGFAGIESCQSTAGALAARTSRGDSAAVAEWPRLPECVCVRCSLFILLLFLLGWRCRRPARSSRVVPSTTKQTAWCEGSTSV